MEIILCSNVVAGGLNYDVKLVNPYSVIKIGKYLYVSCNGANQISKYSTCGSLKGSVTIDKPTGMVYVPDKKCKGILYIASSAGKIYKMSPNDTTATVVATPEGLLQSITYNKGNLYVTTFGQQYIRIYSIEGTDGNSLRDKGLSDIGYTPYGAGCHCDNLYFTFTNHTNSIGTGYVNVYNPKACKQYRLINRGALYTPYGIVVVEDELYVSNSPSGEILIYNLNGKYKKPLTNQEGATLINDGIMGMYYDCDEKILYFVSGPDNGKLGNLGSIKL